MKLTRESIKENKLKLPGIEGYLTVVSKIEENVLSNPDISIESCKSLIEGICLKGLSLLSEKFNSSKKVRSDCKNDLKKLTKMTFEEIYADAVESHVHESLARMIIDTSAATRIKVKAKRKVKEQTIQSVAKVSALRNERGDISHGRNYPKKKESSVHLAKSIQSITDGICSFMIAEIGFQYGIKIKKEQRLDYEEQKNFNLWLNEIHNITTIKVDYSKLIYDTIYEKYEEFYYSEYLPLLEEMDSEILEDEIDLSNTQKPKDKKGNEVIVEASNETLDYLLDRFDRSIFWTDKREQLLIRFIADEKLKLEATKNLVDELIFEENLLFRDEVINLMLLPPNLLERKKVGNELISKIHELVKELKKEE